MEKQLNQMPETMKEAGMISSQTHVQETAIGKDITTDMDGEIAAVLQAIKDQPETYEAIDLIPPELQEAQDEEVMHKEIEEPPQQQPSIETLKEEQTNQSSKINLTEDKTTKDKTKSEVICFRVTKEEYEHLYFQCLNEYGEKLLTVSKLAELTMTGLSKAKAMEQPLERYRLAIAAEIGMAITELVHKLDMELDETDNEIYLSEHGKIIIELENIQKRASMLLTPLTEQVTY